MTCTFIALPPARASSSGGDRVTDDRGGQSPTLALPPPKSTPRSRTVQDLGRASTSWQPSAAIAAWGAGGRLPGRYQLIGSGRPSS